MKPSFHRRRCREEKLDLAPALEEMLKAVCLLSMEKLLVQIHFVRNSTAFIYTNTKGNSRPEIILGDLCCQSLGRILLNQLNNQVAQGLLPESQ